MSGTKRTRAGAIMLKVKGKDKADLLAEDLRKVVGEVAHVKRPLGQFPSCFWASGYRRIDGKRGGRSGGFHKCA